MAHLHGTRTALRSRGSGGLPTLSIFKPAIVLLSGETGALIEAGGVTSTFARHIARIFALIPDGIMDSTIVRGGGGGIKLLDGRDRNETVIIVIDMAEIVHAVGADRVEGMIPLSSTQGGTKVNWTITHAVLRHSARTEW